MTESLYVIKIGSSTILSQSKIFADIGRIVGSGARVLIVAGGGEAIKLKYASIGREIPYLTLKNGERFRYSNPEEMPFIVAAYDEIIGPKLRHELNAVGLDPYITGAWINRLVTGIRSKPLKTCRDGKDILVKDSLVGMFSDVDHESVVGLLKSRKVVCLMPPIIEKDSDNLLNIDADMLAASLCIRLNAHHLRFVTGTHGILSNVSDPKSTIPDIYPDDNISSASGRMKQKVRAALLATKEGIADVAITGSESLFSPERQTRFWPSRPPNESLSLLTHAVGIPSVSCDETELARTLSQYALGRGLQSHIDDSGNLIVRKGAGPVKLMLLGHMDTVPNLWRSSWEDNAITGRGSVDAKGSLINFIEATLAAEVPPWGEILVVGATEEEISSSRGAFYARDHYPANAVIIGEPSGAFALTLGYFGLFKLEINIKVNIGHSAGKVSLSAPDLLYDTVKQLRTLVGILDDAGISSLINVTSHSDVQFDYASGTINFRVSPSSHLEQLIFAINGLRNENISITILRATPGVQTSRSSDVARAFGRAFAHNKIVPRYLVKKGSSDMNTLATTWKNVPMVAYGPGDSALDHTHRERLTAEEYLQARAVLDQAIHEWFQIMEAKQA